MFSFFVLQTRSHSESESLNIFFPGITIEQIRKKISLAPKTQGKRIFSEFVHVLATLQFDFESFFRWSDDCNRLWIFNF